MIFWRVVDNKLYSVGEVNRLGFEESEGLRVPDEYLDKQDDNEIIMFIDAYDVFFLEGEKEILKKFYSYKNPNIDVLRAVLSVFASHHKKWGQISFDYIGERTAFGLT